MSELVSCIVPVHNGAAYLGDAISSLLAQDWPHLEIIVVDDGSTDGSIDIAKRHAHRVKLVCHAAGNPALSRNLGIRTAQGSFISFLDQDDLSVPSRISALMAVLQEQPQLGACVGMVQRVRRTSQLDHVEPVGPAVPGYLTIAMLARRHVFQTVGMLDPAFFYSDSAEWFLRARAAGVQVALLPEVVTYHREHANNRSRTHANDSRREFLKLVKRKLDSDRAGA